MKSTPYLFSLVIAVSTSLVLLGQQRAGTDEIELEESKTALDRATLEIDKWQIVLENEERGTADTDKSSLLRWSWSDNGRRYGNVYVYSAKGRPVAIMQFFSWFKPIEGDYFQCTSLTDIPMTATRLNVEHWRSRSSSVKMQEMPDAPVPAGTASLRLEQRKRLAECFKV